MRTLYHIAICCCALTSCLAAEEEIVSEEAHINLLISATKTSLESLEKLQKSLVAFKEQEKRCLEQPDDVDALFALSECALVLITSIRENKVEPYFRSSFIEELDKLKKAAESKNLPPILSHETIPSGH